MHSTTPSKHALVIGFGNELRCDDGIGPRVAHEIESRDWPEVKTLAVQQLTPELARELAKVRQAIFIDARVPPNETDIEVRQVHPGSGVSTMTHCSNPAQLLGMTKWLYGRTPETWMITAAGENFDLGEKLSPVAEQNMQLAIEWIETLLED